MDAEIVWIVIAGVAVLAGLLLVLRHASRPREIGGATGGSIAPVTTTIRHPDAPVVEAVAEPPVPVASAASVASASAPAYESTSDALLQLSPEVVRAGEQEVRAMAQAGRQLEAIRLVRELTGVGLKEAKDYVDRLPNAPPLTGLMPAAVDLDPELLEELAALLDQGRKIEAIALCREKTGLDLRQAKAIVDGLDETG